MPRLSLLFPLVLALGCASTSPAPDQETVLIAYGHVPQLADISAAAGVGATDPIVVTSVKMLLVQTAGSPAAFSALAGVDSVWDLGRQPNPAVEVFLTTPDSVTAADLSVVASHQPSSGFLDVPYGEHQIHAALHVLSLDSVMVYPRFITIGIAPIDNFLE